MSLESSDEEHSREIESLKRNIADIRRKDFETIGHGKEVYESVMSGHPIHYREEEESLIEYYSVFHHDTFRQWMDSYRNLTSRPLVFLILTDKGKTDTEIQEILGVSNMTVREGVS